MIALARFVYAPILLVFCVTVLLADQRAEADKATKKRNLDALGYEIFEKNILGLERNRRGTTLAVIQDRFGKPLRTASELRPIHDAHPTKGPSHYEELAWTFEGLVLVMSSPLVADDPQTPRKVGLLSVVVSSPGYRLKHGLNIGQTASDFIAVLGKPTRHNKYGLAYQVDNAVKAKTGGWEVDPYQIDIRLDTESKVKEIEWSWWWH